MFSQLSQFHIESLAANLEFLDWVELLIVLLLKLGERTFILILLGFSAELSRDLELEVPSHIADVVLTFPYMLCLLSLTSKLTLLRCFFFPHLKTSYKERIETCISLI